MANKGYVVSKVISNEKLASNIYKMRVEGNFEARAGQFFMLRPMVNIYPYLSRPISVYNITKDYVEFLYMVVGQGTNILKNLRIGDYIKVLGAVGNGFNLKKEFNKVAIISGGIGIAPLLYLAKNINAKHLDVFCGFKDEVYCTDDFKQYGNVYIATEDGSVGEKGYVTTLINDRDYDVAYVCGPMPMMKAISSIEFAKEIFVSLESHMGCGIGACLGCQVKIKNKGILRICTEGPIFKASEVIYD